MSWEVKDINSKKTVWQKGGIFPKRKKNPYRIECLSKYRHCYIDDFICKYIARIVCMNAKCPSSIFLIEHGNRQSITGRGLYFL